MEEKIEKLKQAKVKLEDAQRKEIVLKTKIENVTDQLEKLGHSAISAKKAISELDKTIAKLEDQLDTRITDFEEEYKELFEE